jgi:hypothetical protein
MKKLRLLSLALATVAFVALYSCGGTATKEVKEEAVEEVMEEPAAEEEMVADSTAVSDTVAMEAEENMDEPAE